ncbi:alpha/beta hydrolase [Penicillium malachiteum]|uniref:alpha/beta hydrolase n=1 Tax=Penicillium malachiteum TaxID=1324776 RepID=UPI0025477FEF|nr:alpha/beta hydrolase [Penicillium malachiteum]KAJ5721918.1 alpha/beta hydrolase [Penicillium malachiteum]
MDFQIFQWDWIWAIAKSLNCESIILAGHDCGFMLSSRIVLYYPDFVTHLILLGVPYFPPSQQHISLPTLVKLQPSFQYMLQFCSGDGEIEKHTQTRERIWNFLNPLFGGLTQYGKKAITAAKGIDFELSSQLSLSKIFEEEEMMEYYIDEFSRTGLRCNLYRMWDQNSRDELFIAQGLEGGIIKCPVLSVRPTEDFTITAQVVEAMKSYVPHLQTEDIPSGHWVMLSHSQRLNEILEWLRQQEITV